MHASFLQDQRQWRADPLADVGPALFADDFPDLTAQADAAQIRYRQGQRVRHHAVDHQAPVAEAGRADVT